MCELLGMSANVPTDIVFSFSGLVQRGGKTGPHKDGWGIAFFEKKGIRLYHEPEPSIQSKVAEFLKSYPVRSKLVISHIRKANRGKVTLENTHPFVRELWGRNWVFAHNGQLKAIKKKHLNRFFPIGTTDSEYAFCYILDELSQKLGPKCKPKDLQDAIQTLFTELNSMGVANILLGESKNLYAFCSTKLTWITRKAPFGKAQLIDDDITIDFKKVTNSTDVVTVIATQKLTKNEDWIPMKPGEFSVFQEGRKIETSQKM